MEKERERKAPASSPPKFTKKQPKAPRRLSRKTRCALAAFGLCLLVAMGALFHVEYGKVYRLWAFPQLERLEALQVKGDFLVKQPEYGRIFHIDPERVDTVSVRLAGKDKGKPVLNSRKDKLIDHLNSFRWRVWTWEPEGADIWAVTFSRLYPPHRSGSLLLSATPRRLYPPEQSGSPYAKEGIEVPGGSLPIYFDMKWNRLLIGHVWFYGEPAFFQRLDELVKRYY